VAAPTRWQATVASALCMAVGMSAIFMGSFPVFLQPVSADLGWGRAVFPEVITVSSIAAAVLMPFGGRLVDRIGVHQPVAVGLVLVALAMLLFSIVESVGIAFWAGALALGAGAAFAGPPAFVGLISSWHDRNRALAIAIVLSVAPACSQAVIAPVTQHLIVALGWRDSYRALAALVVAIGVPVSLAMLRRCPSTYHADGPVALPGASARDAVRTPAFWLLAVASCLSSGTLLGFIVHIVAWLTGRGVAGETAAFVLSSVFLAGMAGAFVAGYVADRARGILALQVFYALPIAGLGLMAATTALPVLVAGAVLIGLGTGATTGLSPYLTTRYFGLRASAEIFGMILAMTMVALGVVPVLIGAGYDISGSYGAPLVSAAIALAISTISVGLADRAGRPTRANGPVAETPVA